MRRRVLFISVFPSMGVKGMLNNPLHNCSYKVILVILVMSSGIVPVHECATWSWINHEVIIEARSEPTCHLEVWKYLREIIICTWNLQTYDG